MISHDNAQLCINALTSILNERLYYGADSVVGMGGLLSQTFNSLTTITTTYMATASTILKASKDAAKLGKESNITDRKDHHNEANQLNLYNLSVLSAKEDAAEGPTTFFGRAVTNTILNNVDAGPRKKVENHKLSDLAKAIVNSASCLMYTDVSGHHCKNVAFTFDFR